MKAFITTYNKTDKGLVLRNNFVNEFADYYLKEFLMDYYDDLEILEYQVNSVEVGIKGRGYSSIIEAEKEFVYHIRFCL